jgi:hypothetical protein
MKKGKVLAGYNEQYRERNKVEKQTDQEARIKRQEEKTLRRDEMKELRKNEVEALNQQLRQMLIKLRSSRGAKVVDNFLYKPFVKPVLELEWKGVMLMCRDPFFFASCLSLFVAIGYYCGDAIAFEVKSRKTAAVAREMVRKVLYSEVQCQI